MHDESHTMKMYAIYDHPEDYPTGFVVREWLLSGPTPLAGQGWPAASLDEARGLLPDGVVQIGGPDPSEPQIIETWM
jgi:hypothetical protein